MEGLSVFEERPANSQASWHAVLRRLRESGNADSRRMLLVDPDPESRRSFQQLIEDTGCTLDQATDTNGAFSHCLQRSYDTIILPLSEGVASELLVPLRAMQPNAAFLVAQASGQDAAPLSGLDAGIAGLVRKPWDEAPLLKAIERALRLSCARSSYSSELRSCTPLDYSLLLVGKEKAHSALKFNLSSEKIAAQVTHVRTLADATRALAQEKFDAILTELVLPDAWGLDSVVHLSECNSTTPLLVFTEFNDPALTSEAIQTGAQDVILQREIVPGSLEQRLKSAIERQLAHSKLAHLAHHDGLTKLANRTLFQQRLAEAVARCKRKNGLFGVMYLDLDHFKPINDSRGHAAGDAVLETISRRLQAAVREYDTVARLGGDEFAILLDTLEQRNEATLVAERIGQKVREPIAIGAEQIVMTCSIGVALYPDAGKVPDELLNAADRAMYAAKQQGRDVSCHQLPALRLVRGGSS